MQLRSNYNSLFLCCSNVNLTCKIWADRTFKRCWKAASAQCITCPPSILAICVYTIQVYSLDSGQGPCYIYSCQIQFWLYFEFIFYPPVPASHPLYSAFVLPWPKHLISLQESIHRQSNIGPLCANTYMEMIVSALCKWTLYGFCQLMSLEPSLSDSLRWCLPYPGQATNGCCAQLNHLICRH